MSIFKQTKNLTPMHAVHTNERECEFSVASTSEEPISWVQIDELVVAYIKNPPPDVLPFSHFYDLVDPCRCQRVFLSDCDSVQFDYGDDDYGRVVVSDIHMILGKFHNLSVSSMCIRYADLLYVDFYKQVSLSVNVASRKRLFLLFHDYCICHYYNIFYEFPLPNVEWSPIVENPTIKWEFELNGVVAYCLRPRDGREEFIINGGESNPGPVMSRFLISPVELSTRAIKAGVRYMMPDYQVLVERAQELTRTGAQYGEAFINILRVYTSMVDCFSTFLYRYSAVTSLDLYTRLAVFVKNVYDIIVLFDKNNQASNEMRAHPQAGALETFCATAFLASILPKSLLSILKSFPLFTQFKVVDDASWIFDLLAFVTQIPHRICKLLLPVNEKTKPIFSALASIEESLPFSSMSKYHFLTKEILDEVSKKPSLVGDVNFQERVLKFNKTYQEYVSIFLEDRSVLPTYMIDHHKRLKRLVDKVAYMRSNLRVEPVACIFNGPRGAGKTTLMNLLLQGLSTDNSVYTHMSQLDKDFHDQYDNEDIYVIDDIGQKGAWQYAGLINFVSTSKCPLLCADSDKKGTRFFTSKLIMATTNNINITLTADCGITDIGALHRRLVNFDFHKVKFVEGVYTGSIEVKKYSLDRSIWQVVEIFSAENGEFNMQDIFKYICTDLQKKIDNNKNTYKGDLRFGALPQSLSEEVVIKFKHVKEYFEEVFKHLPTLDEIIGRIFGSKFVSIPLVVSLVALVIAAVMKCYEMFSDRQVSDVGRKTLHYAAAKRTRLRVRSALPQSLDGLFEKTYDVEIQQLSRIESNTVVVRTDFVRDGRQLNSLFTSCISGRYFTGPLHAINLKERDTVFATVYVDKDCVYYDKIECEIVYVNEKDDCVIFALPLLLPKYFKAVKFVEDTYVTDLVLVTTRGVVEVNEKLTLLDCRISYKAFTTGYNGSIGSDDSVTYEKQLQGTCGSLLVTRDGVLLGHHVAEVASMEDGAHGCAKLFSNKTINKIYDLFGENIDYAVQTHKSKTTGSIVRVDDKVFHLVNQESKYAPSEIYEVYPIVRRPANLKAFGKSTVEEMSKKSRKIVMVADIKAMTYATSYVEEIMPEVSVLQTEREIVLGNSEMNRIDPDTSVGYGLFGKKRDYLDYDKGIIGIEMKKGVANFCESVSNGSFKYDLYYAESLKDELKNNDKVQKPRVFKGGPLILTLLYRFFFGNLLSEVSKKRLVNGVMIGINPLSNEWDLFARRLTKFSNCFFDGDWGSWDGGMLTQAQQSLCVVMRKKVLVGSDYRVFNKIFSCCIDEETYIKVFDMCLVLLYNTPTITANRAFITTHSMPSGCALTAFFNSFINKMYGAYGFYILHSEKYHISPNLELYFSNVFDAVYGDDKVTAVKPEISSWFNGRTFSHMANSLGLTFTPADKGEWTYETRSLFECTFLKRAFSVHPSICQVVAPLEPQSMTGTLNFVSDDFRNSELTDVKILNFQREAFLHRNYDELMFPLLSICDERGIQLHTRQYLIDLYVAGDYGEFLELS